MDSVVVALAAGLSGSLSSSFFYCASVAVEMMIAAVPALANLSKIENTI